MTDENKPKEIDALTLDKFKLLVDNVLEKLEETKGFKKTKEVEEVFTELQSTVVTGDNGLANLPIIGDTVGPMMVVQYNIITNKFEAIYSNATRCAESLGLNPTTIRQRAGDKKVIKDVKWYYITDSEYQNLKG